MLRCSAKCREIRISRFAARQTPPQRAPPLPATLSQRTAPPHARTAAPAGMAAPPTGRSVPLLKLPPRTRCPPTRNRICQATTPTPKEPSPPKGHAHSGHPPQLRMDPYHLPRPPLHPPHPVQTPYTAYPRRAGGFPPTPKYPAAPDNALLVPPTPPEWPGFPRRSARSHKRHCSPSPPRKTPASRPGLSRSQRHNHASPAPRLQSCRTRSPRHRHNIRGPRSSHSRSPGHHHAGHRRPMSASPCPDERHRASCSPRHRHASLNPSPHHRRTRTRCSKPSSLTPAAGGLLVRPRLAGALPLGEVGSGSGQARLAQPPPQL